MSPVTLWGTEVDRFNSSIVDQEFELQLAVMTPEGHEGPVPVVYLTDANTSFAAVHQIVGLLQMGQQLPPLCLAGIGYPFEAPVTSSPALINEWIQLRARDLLSAKVDHTVLPHPVLDTWGGGADAFVSCLIEEIEPRVAALVDIDSQRRTIVGHSGGGHFAIYAALTRPQIFPKVLAASPAMLNYDGLESLVPSWAEQPATAAQHLFIGATESEREQLVAEMYMMTRALREAAPATKIETFLMPGETHLSVWPTLYVRGLTTLLAPTP